MENVERLLTQLQKDGLSTKDAAANLARQQTTLRTKFNYFNEFFTDLLRIHRETEALAATLPRPPTNTDSTPMGPSQRPPKKKREFMLPNSWQFQY